MDYYYYTTYYINDSTKSSCIFLVSKYGDVSFKVLFSTPFPPIKIAPYHGGEHCPNVSWYHLMVFCIKGEIKIFHLSGYCLSVTVIVIINEVLLTYCNCTGNQVGSAAANHNNSWFSFWWFWVSCNDIGLGISFVDGNLRKKYFCCLLWYLHVSHFQVCY